MEYKHERHDEFIQNILTSRGRFEIPEGDYKERHHIIPSCMGGLTVEDNLIDLYAREHFIAHKLLAEENPDIWDLVNAYGRMAFCKQPNGDSYELTPEEYEEAKKLFSESWSKQCSDIWKNYSEDEYLTRCKNISDSLKGKTGHLSWNKGLTKDTDKRIKGHQAYPNQVVYAKTTKGDKYIWKNGVKKRIKPDELSYYLEDGWSTTGPLMRWVTNGIETKHILQEDVEKWLSQGYRIGHNHKTSDGGDWKRKKKYE